MCPDGAYVPWCTCGQDRAWDCLASPEAQCSSTCHKLGEHFVDSTGSEACCADLTRAADCKPGVNDADQPAQLRLPEVRVFRVRRLRRSGLRRRAENFCNCPADRPVPACTEGATIACNCDSPLRDVPPCWHSADASGVWQPITYFRDPCLCQATTDCQDGFACEVGTGKCLPDCRLSKCAVTTTARSARQASSAIRTPGCAFTTVGWRRSTPVRRRAGSARRPTGSVSRGPRSRYQEGEKFSWSGVVEPPPATCCDRGSSLCRIPYRQRPLHRHERHLLRLHVLRERDAGGAPPARTAATARSTASDSSAARRTPARPSPVTTWSRETARGSRVKAASPPPTRSRRAPPATSPSSTCSSSCSAPPLASTTRSSPRAAAARGRSASPVAPAPCSSPARSPALIRSGRPARCSWITSETAYDVTLGAPPRLAARRRRPPPSPRAASRTPPAERVPLPGSWENSGQQIGQLEQRPAGGRPGEQERPGSTRRKGRAEPGPPPGGASRAHSAPVAGTDHQPEKRRSQQEPDQEQHEGEDLHGSFSLLQGQSRADLGGRKVGRGLR